MIKLSKNTTIVFDTESSTVTIYGNIKVDSQDAKITLSEVCNSQCNDAPEEL